MSHILIWVMTCSVLLTPSLATDGLGVNWGTQSAQVLDPDVIVQILKDNNIKKIKLFDSDIWTVKHFAGTGIEVMVGVPNNQLERFAKDYDNAKDYVKNNVSAHLKKGGVDIK
ncbi:glucosidase [Lithospermum erythrorhizon]|uniref:Glucosidase n=1 Tax=Lithospermum erythrorhizon TaxID=34254 RepID=A0AAV3QBH9_LITER